MCRAHAVPTRLSDAFAGLREAVAGPTPGHAARRPVEPERLGPTTPLAVTRHSTARKPRRGSIAARPRRASGVRPGSPAHVDGPAHATMGRLRLRRSVVGETSGRLAATRISRRGATGLRARTPWSRHRALRPRTPAGAQNARRQSPGRPPCGKRDEASSGTRPGSAPPRGSAEAAPPACGRSDAVSPPGRAAPNSGSGARRPSPRLGRPSCGSRDPESAAGCPCDARPRGSVDDASPTGGRSAAVSPEASRVGRGT
ncbi:hypothetical protein ACU686_41150 [Yinghuangia aomiensis]